MSAGSGAFAEIEAEAELLQELELPMDEEHGPHVPLSEGAQHMERRGVELRMRIALGQQLDRPASVPMAARAAASSSTRAPWASIISTLKPPRCSDRRARQVTRMRLPGWSTGRMRRERPPRTSPRWRPCSSVNSSATALVSPKWFRRKEDAFVNPIHALAWPSKGALPIPLDSRGPSRGTVRGRRPNARAP